MIISIHHHSTRAKQFLEALSWSVPVLPPQSVHVVVKRSVVLGVVLVGVVLFKVGLVFVQFLSQFVQALPILG